jgi:hypothetical protein
VELSLPPMTFIPHPLLPTAANLAARAALLPVPAVLSVFGHDLVIHAAAGQLLPLAGLEPGTHLLDRPLSTRAKQTALHRLLRALHPGEPQRFASEAHGHRWLTTMEPIPHPLETETTRSVLGVLCTGVLADVPALEAPDDDLIGCYTATADDGEIHAGDVITCRRSGIVCRTEAIRQSCFDHALARGILTLAGSCDEARPASPRRGARVLLRLLRA